MSLIDRIVYRVGVVWIKLGRIVICIVLLVFVVVMAGLVSGVCGHLERWCERKSMQ